MRKTEPKVDRELLRDLIDSMRNCVDELAVDCRNNEIPESEYRKLIEVVCTEIQSYSLFVMQKELAEAKLYFSIKRHVNLAKTKSKKLRTEPTAKQ